jgi:hypothetical protein
MKKLASLFIVVLVAAYNWYGNNLERVALPSALNHTAVATDQDQILSNAYKNKRRDIQVRGAGTVEKILPDDNKGSRHQKFILRLASGQTILVAHNIDLAPRVAGLQTGDNIAFYGEYEWTDRGGVVHWTHHDPAGRHVGGWLEHGGRRYE